MPGGGRAAPPAASAAGGAPRLQPGDAVVYERGGVAHPATVLRVHCIRLPPAQGGTTFTVDIRIDDGGREVNTVPERLRDPAAAAAEARRRPLAASGPRTGPAEVAAALLFLPAQVALLKLFCLLWTLKWGGLPAFFGFVGALAFTGGLALAATHLAGGRRLPVGSLGERLTWAAAPAFLALRAGAPAWWVAAALLPWAGLEAALRVPLPPTVQGEAGLRSLRLFVVSACLLLFGEPALGALAALFAAGALRLPALAPLADGAGAPQWLRARLAAMERAGGVRALLLNGGAPHVLAAVAVAAAACVGVGVAPAHLPTLLGAAALCGVWGAPSEG